MSLSWGNIIRLCLVNAAIGGLAAMPVNLFNRLMTVEMALPALLPGFLVALHYGVQLTRPVWGHRSDTKGGRTPFIIGGIAVVALGVVGAAWGIQLGGGAASYAVWIVSYIAIGLGIGAGGTSFLALLATASGPRKGAAATLAWLFLIIGAIASSVAAAITLAPYSPERLIIVVAGISAAALLLTCLGTIGIERGLPPQPTAEQAALMPALRQTMADPQARNFTGFVFLSILAFYLSELILEPFAGHIHGLTPEQSTGLGGAKDGAALLGMIAAGVLAHFGRGSLRTWAVVGCVLSAAGLIALGLRMPLIPATLTLGLGNGLFVVGAIGSMMQLAAAHERATGTRMGVFGAAQAIASGAAALTGTAVLDASRLAASDMQAYATVFTIEAFLFLAAAVVAARLLHQGAPASAALQPGE